jgi:hypothetical protein
MTARTGRPCVPEAEMPVAGLTCSAGGLTMSVAVRVWVPCPVSVSAKVMVALYVAAARVFAFAFTVNVTVVPDDAVPEVAEAVSQLGTPDMA